MRGDPTWQQTPLDYKDKLLGNKTVNVYHWSSHVCEVSCSCSNSSSVGKGFLFFLQGQRKENLSLEIPVHVWTDVLKLMETRVTLA